MTLSRVLWSPVLLSRVMRVAVSGVVLGAVLVGAGDAGAQADDVLEPVDSVAFAETGGVSPLSPGIESQRHFSQVGIWAPVASETGFVDLDGDLSEFEIHEISIDGTVIVEGTALGAASLRLFGRCS